jgi:hypothetical protein
MTQPRFLNTTVCPYSYSQTAGMTDVATIITDIRTALVTGLGWTEPSTALFKCPSLGGLWFDILLTRITALKIEMRVRNHLGFTICTRRFTIVSPTSINYFCTKYSVVIEALTATPELLQAHYVDVLPMGDGDYQFPIFANGFRTTADADDGQGKNVGYYFTWEDTTAVFSASRGLNASHDSANNQVTRFMGSGSMLCEDAILANKNAAFGAWPIMAGRLWHAFWVDSTIAFGTDKVLAVDDASSATFRVVGLITAGTTRLALRK